MFSNQSFKFSGIFLLTFEVFIHSKRKQKPLWREIERTEVKEQYSITEENSTKAETH